MRSPNARVTVRRHVARKLRVAAPPALEPLGAEEDAAAGGARAARPAGVIASVVSARVPVGAPRATTKPAASIAARTAVDAE